MAVKKKPTKKVVKKKEDERKVPFKNYLILLLLCIITVTIFAGGSVLYRKSEKSKLEISALEGVVPEISINDLDNYSVENDLFYLYIGATNDYNSYSIEKELLDYTKKKDLKNFVRIDARKINNFKEFADSFNIRFSMFDYSKLKSYPAFIIVKDGKILNLVQKSDDSRISIGDIDTLLDEYGL